MRPTMRSARALAPVPGLVVASALWLLTRLRFDYESMLEGPGSWHYLGPHLLTDKPVESLLALHVQPPGVNALRAVDLALTPGSHIAIGLTYLILMLATVALVVDTLVEVGPRPRWAAASGVGLALLPATVLYAFSANSTIPTMAGCALAIWGVARMGRQPSLGAAASALGTVWLFAFRSSFTWLFALVWLVAVGLLLRRLGRRRGRRVRGGVAAVVTAGLLVVGIQAHYLASFGVGTLSSWTGENLFKALRQSNHLHVTGDAVAKASALGPCHASLISAIAAGEDLAWQPTAFYELPGCADLLPDETTGIEALDSSSADGLDDGAWQGNFNWAGRLRASAVFTDVMRVVVLDDPSQLVYMAVSGGSGQQGSGLSIYLSPADGGVFMASMRSAYPNQTLGGVIGLFFAPVALFLGLLGAVLAIAGRDRGRLRRQAVFWFGLGMVAYHLPVSTLVEYGENNRFQAEIAPVLTVVAALVLWAVVPPKPAQTAPRPWTTARTVRASRTMSPDSDHVST